MVRRTRQHGEGHRPADAAAGAPATLGVGARSWQALSYFNAYRAILALLLLGFYTALFGLMGALLAQQVPLDLRALLAKMVCKV